VTYQHNKRIESGKKSRGKTNTKKEPGAWERLDQVRGEAHQHHPIHGLLSALFLPPPSLPFRCCTAAPLQIVPPSGEDERRAVVEKKA